MEFKEFKKEMFKRGGWEMRVRYYLGKPRQTYIKFLFRIRKWVEAEIDRQWDK